MVNFVSIEPRPTCLELNFDKIQDCDFDELVITKVRPNIGRGHDDAYMFAR